MSSMLTLLFLSATSSPDPFLCPPYLQDLSEHGVAILWKQSGRAEAQVTLTRMPDGARLVKKVAGGKLRSVTWRKLTPHRRYRYTVEVAGKTYDGTFVTGRSPNRPFVFLAFGDTRYNVSEHRAVVEAMSLERADLIIHTGDVVHKADEGLYERFFRVEHPILASAPLYPALGNHELSRSWTRGRKLFETYFRIENRGPCLGLCYSLVYGNSLFLFLDSNVPILGASQETWAMDQLVEASTDPSIRHIFVVIHHGPFSSGPHGPNWDLADSDLFEAFQRFGVDIVFSGHDHLYERGRVGRVTYLVTAGGGAPLYPVKHVLSTTRVVEPVFHYVRVRVSGPSVVVASFKKDGSLLDWFRLGPQAPLRSRTGRVPTVPDRLGRKRRRPRSALPRHRFAASGKTKSRSGGCRTAGGNQGVFMWILFIISISMGRTKHAERRKNEGHSIRRKRT